MMAKTWILKSVIVIFLFTFLPLLYNNQTIKLSFAYSTSPTSELHVTYWYTENDLEKPGVLQLVNDFNSLGIQVNGQTIVIDAVQKGFFNAKQDFITAYAIGNEPNLFRSTRDWVSEFGYTGLIQPLEGFFNQTDLNDFIYEGIRMSTYINVTGQTHLFAIPQQLDGAALMYNKYILQQAGIDTSQLNSSTSWTWTEFLDNVNLIYNRTGVCGYTLAGMDFGAQALYFGNGGRLFLNNNVSIDSIAINRTQSRYAFQFIKNLVDSNVTPSYMNQGWNTINPYFANGQVAMIQQGPWQLKDFLDNSPEFNATLADAKPYASPDNLGFMEFPKDTQGFQGVPLSMQAYVISSRVVGDVLNATVKFLKFITSEQAEVYQAINFFHVPARNSAYQNYNLTSSSSWPYIQGFKNNIDMAPSLPVHHAWSIMQSNFANELDAYLAGYQDLNTMIKGITNWWYDSIGRPLTTTSTITTTLTSTITTTIISIPASSLSSSQTTNPAKTSEFNTIFFLLGLTPLIYYTRMKRKVEK